MITVFYDGKCGLCRREINHYIRVAPAGVFDWCDVTRKDAPLSDLNLTYVEALKSLHARDSTGKLHVGVDAFILIWRHIPRWRPLGWFAGLPVVREVAKLLYRAFAAWRFRRLDHCQVALSASQNQSHLS